MDFFKISEVTKNFSSGDGISDINLTLKKGDFLGLLGDEGAGKTAVIRILLGLIKPKTGEVTLFGEKTNKLNFGSVLKKVGYVPAELDFYKGNNGLNFLNFMGINKAIDKDYRDRVLKSFGLDKDILKLNLLELEVENRKKLMIAAALQHRPELLIMDEPTEGLSLADRETFYMLIEECLGRGGAVFIASQNAMEVEMFCTKVALMHKGKIISLETPENLSKKAIYNITVEMDPPLTFKALKGMSVSKLRDSGRAVTFQNHGNIDILMRHILETGNVKNLQCVRGTIEETIQRFYKEGGVKDA